MFPAVPVPGGGQVRIPVEAKLKPGWRYDSSRRVFVSDAGDTFKPTGLPAKARIVPKIPQASAAKKLSKAEQDLRRYLQVILPPGESASDYVDAVRTWPCVAEASTGPDITLP